MNDEDFEMGNGYGESASDFRDDDYSDDEEYCPDCDSLRDEYCPHCDGDSDDFSEFADPGGNSALRAETPSNPRNLPCPTCKQPNRLTPKDKRLGYQCNACADRAEGGGY